VLIGAAVLGLVVGLIAGGSLWRLADVKLHWPGLLFGAVVLRYGTEIALERGLPIVGDLRLPLFALAFVLLLAGLYQNRALPGLSIVAAGVAANGLVVLINGGWMPVWGQSLVAAGLTTVDLAPAFHQLLPPTLDAGFVGRLGFLGDILPVPLPVIRNVASVGDVVMAIGIGWFLFATALRGAAAASRPPTARETDADGGQPLPMRRPLAAALSRAGVRPETGLASFSVPGGALMIDRGSLTPAVGMAIGDDLALGGIGPAAQPALPPIVARFGRHPYVRLALDARFSAFWIGQTVSLFGDRLNQVALAVLVFGVTSSPLATALVFLTASAPNLLLGPIAGPFVDRWDQKSVLVVSDLIRAALVILLPLAAVQSVWLVFPIVFLVTVVSMFFRPAKAAVVPRLVRPEDLMAANSATWTGETLADIAGYPLAGLFVALLGSELPLAFWADAASYLVSAFLIAGLVIPPVMRTIRPVVGSAIGAFVAELAEGFRFLRSQPALFQNTLVSAVAQMSIGATLALAVVYARDALSPAGIPYPTNYTAIEAAIGIGNLVGGLAVGAVGVQARKGWLIGLGILVMGASVAILGLTSNVYLAIVLAVVQGIANLVFVIPTQTLFAELTPMPLMGRVVAFRSSLVFGAMTLAMAIAGGLAQVAPVGIVIAAFGALTTLMGLLCLALPAIRES
jgi:MFS family permease